MFDVFECAAAHPAVLSFSFGVVVSQEDTFVAYFLEELFVLWGREVCSYETVN